MNVFILYVKMGIVGGLGLELISAGSWVHEPLLYSLFVYLFVFLLNTAL